MVRLPSWPLLTTLTDRPKSEPNGTIADRPTFGMPYPDSVARRVGTSKSSRYRWEGIAIALRAVHLVHDLVSSSCPEIRSRDISSLLLHSIR